MAIKGKKKSKGGSTRRRPAAAPRPTYTSRRPPWFRTAAGRVAIVTGAVALVIAGIALFMNSRSNQRDLEARQERLVQYTGAVEALIGAVSPPVQEMSAVFGGTPPPTLAEDAQGWVDALQEAQSATGVIAPVPETEKLNPLFGQASSLYLNAAQLFLAASGVDQAREQSEVIARAGEVRIQADQMLLTAISLLDELRAEAELPSSGLASPLEGATDENPITITPPEGGGDG